MVAFALDLRGTPHERWPDLMLLIGDQVYADNPGPATRKLIEQRRDPSEPPGYEVADFGEYCFLYREAWTEPSVRWLLSVVPTAMIFDDHDVHDDWNTSASWRRDYQAKPWWPDRIRAAYMSYWIYQHLGNLSPAELAKNELWQQMQEPGDQAGPLGDFAVQADQLARGYSVELPAHLRRGAHRRDRLAQRPGARGRPAADGRRGGVAVGHRVGGRRLEPRRARHLAAAAAPVRHPRARGVERGRLRRSLGPAPRARRRADPPGAGPGTLGGVRQVVRPVRGAAHRAGDGDLRPPARLGHRARRRHPPQLPGRRGLPARH